eukprot:TRINITY_DN3594_c0_g1_i1.p1 TRINITY_DN3594_c0_g1~~TRINITY_DN3594_c0_g1_i1.p1  ORF type:complete len:245 (+),score=41.85 TRINITY_DN3594_c0_g1_i1:23-736(+)
MGSVALTRPGSMNLAFIFLCLVLVSLAVACIVPMELVYIHNHGVLNYDHDYEPFHDACQALGLVACLFLAWYLTLCGALLLEPLAMREGWALNLLGYPSIIFGAVGLYVCTYLKDAFQDHDEHVFGSVLSSLVGFELLLITLIVYTVSSRPLACNYKYAWLYLRNYIGGGLLLFLLISIYSAQYRAVTGSGLSLLFLTIGLIQTKHEATAVRSGRPLSREPSPEDTNAKKGSSGPGR